MKSPLCFATLVLFAALSYSTVSNAYGPWYGAGGGYSPYGYGGGYAPYGYGGGYSEGGVGGVASGMANLVSAQGQRNVENSQAAINYEKAAIEKQKAISAGMENVQKLRSNRDQLKQKTAAKDAANREAEKVAEAKRQQFEADHRPPPLSPRQLDPMTGKIEWPNALQSFDFLDVRTSIDKLFKTRAESGPSDDLSVRIQEQIHKLKNQLRARIQQIPLPEVSESRKFLDRLANSVEPPDSF